MITVASVILPNCAQDPRCLVNHSTFSQPHTLACHLCKLGFIHYLNYGGFDVWYVTAVDAIFGTTPLPCLMRIKVLVIQQ